MLEIAVAGVLGIALITGALAVSGARRPAPIKVRARR